MLTMCWFSPNKIDLHHDMLSLDLGNVQKNFQDVAFRCARNHSASAHAVLGNQNELREIRNRSQYALDYLIPFLEPQGR